MSYTYIHLPKLDTLKKIISENPIKLEYYAKYGGLIGPTESVNYLNQQINEYHNSKN